MFTYFFIPVLKYLFFPQVFKADIFKDLQSGPGQGSGHRASFEPLPWPAGTETVAPTPNWPLNTQPGLLCSLVHMASRGTALAFLLHNP